MDLQYPYMFRLTNPRTGNQTHAGVAEFSSSPGVCLMPFWMMENLLLDVQDHVHVEYVNLPKGTYVKFQPQSVEFLEIDQPKAVLEYLLRQYPTFTVGDVPRIKFGNKTFDLAVLELQPANAVSLIETDMVTEFEAPVGYKEPEVPSKQVVKDDDPVWVRQFGYNIRGFGEEIEVPSDDVQSARPQKSKSESVFKGTGHTLR
ncbi:hypothetical protein GEMRC1_006780 [Eukaryota sp. GEM-RC1]